MVPKMDAKKKKLKSKSKSKEKKRSNERFKRLQKEARTELINSVRDVFETEARDPILLGEIRSALSDPKRRDEARTRIITCLFRGKAARLLAKVMAKTRPAWVSELSHLRLRRAVKKYRQLRTQGG